MSNTLEIVAIANLLITLVNNGNKALAPILALIQKAHDEGRDLTNEEVDEVSDRVDAARKRAEDRILGQ